MPLGLFLYKSLTRLITPFLGVIFRRRAKSGKEDLARIAERFSESPPPRPDQNLIWFHAASVGESQVLLELARRLLGSGIRDVTLLFTCQTQTASRLVENALSGEVVFKAKTCLQLMAPIDEQKIVEGFLDHWSPALAVFAEGEIWPNTLLALNGRNVPSVLINARMTEKSIRGWMRWRKTARKIFETFDLQIAADIQTKTGLMELSGKAVTCPGNLKSALPAPAVDDQALAKLTEDIGNRPTMLAASTHAGEEALMVDAWLMMEPRPFLIIAPRHPNRGNDVDKLLSMTKSAIARRSEGDPVTPATEILLADTMGEMGLWYRLADCVYLGGGHAPGVGGHNPLEALQLGKPVLTGPSVFNFRDLSERLLPLQGFSIVHGAEELASSYPALPVSAEMTEMLKSDALGPMAATLAALEPVLVKAGLRS